MTESCEPPRPAADARVREGLVYARPGGAALRLDLATPPGPGPHPFVLVIHGGGWAAGERAHVRDELLSLAGLGYAAAGLDYRLVDDRGGGTFPAAVSDARCAVRFLRRQAARYDLAPDRAAVLGYSAGGHLAQMLATAADVEGLDDGCEDERTSPSVQAAVAFFAPADLRPHATYGRAADRVIARFLGGPRASRPDRSALASPLAHVDGADAPMLLVHGTDDRVVPVDQSRRMRAALSRVGVGVQYVEVAGAGHGFRLVSSSRRDRAAVCTAVAFLQAALSPSS